MRGRNLQLDLLRCLAIVEVLLAHTVHFHQPRWWWDRILVTPGWTGVDLFFVISGFLISGLLFAEYQKRGRIRFRRFAIRRALKLYPTLYILVFGVLLKRLVAAHFHNVGPIVQPALHDIFFVQSYVPGTYGHFWSLSVEEHFYILLPLTLFLMLRKAQPGERDPFRKLPLIFAIVATVTLSIRLVHGALVHPYSYFTHLFPTHLRLDSLSFGVLLSYWYRFHPDRFGSFVKRTRRYLLPVSLLLILPPVFLDQSNYFIHTVGLTFLYIGYGGLTIALLQVPLTTSGFPGCLLRPLSYIGQHSYPIYLFHLAILMELMKTSWLHSWSGAAIYFSSTIAIGILLSKAIEFPVLRWRDRTFPGEVAAHAAAASTRTTSPESVRPLDYSPSPPLAPAIRPSSSTL